MLYASVHVYDIERFYGGRAHLGLHREYLGHCAEQATLSRTRSAGQARAIAHCDFHGCEAATASNELAHVPRPRERPYTLQVHDAE